MLGWFKDDVALCPGDARCAEAFTAARTAWTDGDYLGRREVVDYFVGNIPEPPDVVLVTMARAAQQYQTLGLKKVMAKHAARVTRLAQDSTLKIQSPSAYVTVYDFQAAEAANVDPIKVPTVSAWVAPDVGATALAQADSSKWWIAGGLAAAVAILLLGR